MEATFPLSPPGVESQSLLVYSQTFAAKKTFIDFSKCELASHAHCEMASSSFSLEQSSTTFVRHRAQQGGKISLSSTFFSPILPKMPGQRALKRPRFFLLLLPVKSDARAANMMSAAGLASSTGSSREKSMEEILYAVSLAPVHAESITWRIPPPPPPPPPRRFSSSPSQQ